MERRKTVKKLRRLMMLNFRDSCLSSMRIWYVHHCALSEGKTAAAQYDVVFCAQNFANMFKDAEKKGTQVIGLRNIMSAQEIEQKMREHGIID